MLFLSLPALEYSETIHRFLLSSFSFISQDKGLRRRPGSKFRNIQLILVPIVPVLIDDVMQSINKR